MPIGATMDLQYRLPPFQQILYTPTIIVSFILLVIAIIVVAYLSHRARVKARIESRLEALRTAEKILLKRGGTVDDVQRILYIFKNNPELDPASIVMVRDNFHFEMLPLLEQAFDEKFAERMETIFFPPPKDTRHAINDQNKDIKTLTEEKKSVATGQTPAAILDLMDATLRPGVLVKLGFEGVEGGYDGMVMGHDMQSINVTLPANNNQLVASLRPGMKVEGSLESGPSLMAFTSNIIQAVAGSMPYCRIAAWKTAWEVRKRESVRLPISLDIDFQHISTATSESIKISNLDKEIGSVRPGKLIDISLGGCCIETPSSGVFRIGDMIRFSKSLVTGNPPATLLGALVNVDYIDPVENDGSKQRLHVQFLIIDDVSQRILVRTIRQLQDLMERDEWMQAQQLLQKMRRNRIQNIGSPAGAGRRESTRYYTTGSGQRPATGQRPGTGQRTATGSKGTGANRPVRRDSTHAVGTRTPGTRAKPPTRSLPPVPPAPAKPNTRSAPRSPGTAARPNTANRPKPPSSNEQ